MGIGMGMGKSTAHYTTLHYATLHYTTLHYTTLHYTTLQHSTAHGRYDVHVFRVRILVVSVKLCC